VVLLIGAAVTLAVGLAAQSTGAAMVVGGVTGVLTGMALAAVQQRQSKGEAAPKAPGKRKRWRGITASSLRGSG
jgi:hypothetical protein